MNETVRNKKIMIRNNQNVDDIRYIKRELQRQKQELLNTNSESLTISGSSSINNSQIEGVVEAMIAPITTTATHTTLEDGTVLNLSASSYEDITLQITQAGAGATKVTVYVSEDNVKWDELFYMESDADLDNGSHTREISASYAKYTVETMTATSVKCTLTSFV